MLDQRGQLLRAPVGFAGCSMPSYDQHLSQCAPGRTRGFITRLSERSGSTHPNLWRPAWHG